MKVLVAYATCHGSTAEIGQRIAQRLESAGHTVDCRPMKEVRKLTYDAAVLGSAIHNQLWLAEATDFVARFGPDLADIPVWLFSVGMPAALPSRLQRWAGQEADLVAAKLAPSIRPRSHHLFSGVIRKEHLTHSGRARFRLMGGRYGDYRDGGQIDAWADAVAQELGPAGRAAASA
jgi:menaquinone-dependent protoporphyrinogen oxidase